MNLTVISKKKIIKQYKNVTRIYTLDTHEGVKTLCKELFLKTLNVSNGRVERALKNKRANRGVPSIQKRGKNVKRKTVEEDKKYVMEHIASFPRYIYHYTRHQQEHRQYLAPNINMKIMYRLYKERCLSQSNTTVRESYYRYIFNTEFNLHFHQPIKDSCQKCDRFQILLKCIQMIM